LNDGTHTGWRIYIDDENDADDVFDEYIFNDASSPSFTTTYNVTTGNSYRAKIKLCSQVGCSAMSQISNSIKAASVPSIPTNVRVMSSDNNNIRIAW